MTKGNTNAYLTIRKNNLDWKRFLKRIAVLEAGKRDNIPEETIKVWFEVFQSMNWSEEQLDSKFQSVMKNTTYGTVRIDDFFKDEEMFTRSEMLKFVDYKVKYLIKQGEDILKFEHPAKDIHHFLIEFFRIRRAEVKVAVANKIMLEYESERRDFFEDIIERQAERERIKIKAVKKRLQSLNFDQRVALLGSLEKQGIIRLTENIKDAFIANIHIFADKITNEQLQQIERS